MWMVGCFVYIQLVQSTALPSTYSIYLLSGTSRYAYHLIVSDLQLFNQHSCAEQMNKLRPVDPQG